MEGGVLEEKSCGGRAGRRREIKWRRREEDWGRKAAEGRPGAGGRARILRRSLAAVLEAEEHGAQRVLGGQPLPRVQQRAEAQLQPEHAGGRGAAHDLGRGLLELLARLQELQEPLEGVPVALWAHL